MLTDHLFELHAALSMAHTLAYRDNRLDLMRRISELSSDVYLELQDADA